MQHSEKTSMLNFKNLTALSAKIIPVTTSDNKPQYVCIIKTGFQFDQNGNLTPIITNVQLTDNYILNVAPKIVNIPSQSKANRKKITTSIKINNGKFIGGEVLIIKEKLSFFRKHKIYITIPPPNFNIILQNHKLSKVCSTIILNHEKRQLYFVYRAIVPWPQDSDYLETLFLRSM